MEPGISLLSGHIGVTEFPLVAFLTKPKRGGPSSRLP
jgi:hypothetical protein